MPSISGEVSRYTAGVTLIWGVMLVVELAGCFRGSPVQCDSNSDCFVGEECRNGVCKRVATIESDTEREMDTVTEDTSEVGVADTSEVGVEDTTEGPAVGDSCSEGECAKGTCIEETCSHVIAVTNRAFEGNLGGVEGADQKCRTAAKRPLLQNSSDEEWKAVVSTGEQSTWARNRLAVQAGVYDARQNLFARPEDDIWGPEFEPRTAPNFQLKPDDGDELYDGRVWTATGAGGTGESSVMTPFENCDSWTASGGGKNGNVGESSKTSASDWVDVGEQLFCDQTARIYCINGQ